MAKIDELISILSKQDRGQAYTRAKSKNTCIICNQSAVNFKSKLAKFEYNNSAICQCCQTEYLSQ